MTDLTKHDSYLFEGNAEFIEAMYQQYCANPQLVDIKWHDFFAKLGKLELVAGTANTANRLHAATTTNKVNSTNAQDMVFALVTAYRQLSARVAKLDPLELTTINEIEQLSLKYYNLVDNGEDKFYMSLASKLANNVADCLTLSAIVQLCQSVYCNKIGFEFYHVTVKEQFYWLTDYAEKRYLNYILSAKQKEQILAKLTQAEGFERFLHTKYVGQKRFSLEGGEAFIAGFDHLIQLAAKNKITHIVCGMAHRGRLNALVNIAGKVPQQIFDEFEGNYHLDELVTGSDVKYHAGHKCNYITADGEVQVTIAYNPSHLEVVNPVVNGMVRALQDKLNVNDKSSVLSFLVHGDSAFIGLGVNQGVFTMAYTEANCVNGTIHLVINNQIGFTTANVSSTRSSFFCSDLAKMIEAPIIHVNGDDVESLLFAFELALDYRLRFARDVVIDLVCFRRHGHNEADDPTLTQMVMYKKIKAHPGIRQLYANELIAQNIIKSADAAAMLENYRLALNRGIHIMAKQMPAIAWYADFSLKTVLAANENDAVVTAISNAKLKMIGKRLNQLPTAASFTLHPTINKLVQNRSAMIEGALTIDFGMAEMLAYASLIEENAISTRLVGEDSERGTFSHRHAIWHDSNSYDTYSPLVSFNNSGQGRFSIFNSVLNEDAALGFEYGYSCINLNQLIIWEAQFGDFANMAQVIIDQFIASAKAKWGIISRLTLLLPHGYDGQGPEHSSARIERFLQLSAEDNWRLAVPSTASQMFHLLRYQALTNCIKPLVIFISKRLLRYNEAKSSLVDFTKNNWQKVIGATALTAEDTATIANIDNKQVNKVIVCSGQIYYDIKNAFINAKGIDIAKVAIIRLEQLYPLPQNELVLELSKYTKAQKFIWVQEEHYNQGAWLHLAKGLNDTLVKCNFKQEFAVISRVAAASPACGNSLIHNTQLQQLLKSVVEY